MAADSTTSHWDDTYAAGEITRSWYQQHPGMSLRMLDAAGIRADASVIDLGRRASPLAGALLERGFRELGRRWTLISQDREEHHTPAGVIQPFTWAVLRRQP